MEVVSRIEGLECELPFADLLLDFVKANDLKSGQFTVYTGFSREMYNQITGKDKKGIPKKHIPKKHIPNKQTLKTICVGMGFSLLLTRVSMYVAGSNLSPTVFADEVYADYFRSDAYRASFTCSRDVAGLVRIAECNEYMSKQGVEKKLLLKDNVMG